MSFQERKDRPVFTFVGKNGAGKTSFFLAIMWALYGEKAIESYAENRPADKQAPKNNLDLMNSDVRENSARPSMRVSLIFEHNGLKHFLFRTVASKIPNPRSNRDLGSEDLKLTIGGKGKEEQYPQGVIDDILPADAFQFFFFDGEDVRRYSGATSSLTRDAIEQVLGIPEIRDARDDLERIQKKLLKQLQNDPGLSENLKRLSEGLSKAIDEHRQFTDTLATKKSELTQTREERIQKEARREELKDIAELNAQLKTIVNEYNRTKDSLDEVEKKRDELIRQLHYYLIRPKVRETLERFKQKSGTDDLSEQITVARTKISLLKDLQKPGTDKCYCGTPLEEMQRKYIQNLVLVYENQLLKLNEKAAKKTIPPIEEIQYVLGRLEGIQVDFRKHEETISKLRADLLELDDRKLQIQSKIKGSNVAEAVKVQELIEELAKKEGALEQEIRNLEELVSEAHERKARLEGLLRKAQYEQGIMSTISARQNLASQLVSALGWIVDKLSERKKELIIQNASKFFNGVASAEGWTGVSIENDYSIWLLDGKKRYILPSEGYKEIVALSFIYGLNKAANYKAPVVMDFVLGRLDSERQLAVVNSLHDFADQILVFLLDTEIQSEAVERRLGSISSSRYIIERSDGISKIQVAKS